MSVTDVEWLEMKRHLLEHRTPAGNIVLPRDGDSALFYPIAGIKRERYGQEPRQPAYIVTCVAEAFRRALQGVETDTENFGEVLVTSADDAATCKEKVEIWEDASFNNPASNITWAKMRKAIVGIKMTRELDEGDSDTVLIKDDGGTTILDVIGRISGGDPDEEEPTIVRAYVEMFRRFIRRLSVEEGQLSPIGAKEPFVAGEAQKWMLERRRQRLVGIRTLMRKNTEALLAEIRLNPEVTLAELVVAAKWSWAYQKDPLYTLRQGVVLCQGTEDPRKSDYYERRSERDDWQIQCKLQLFYGLTFMQQEDLVMRAATPEDQSELASESRKFFEGLGRDLSGFLSAHCWALPADLLFKGVKYQLTLMPTIPEKKGSEFEYDANAREIDDSISHIKRNACLDTSILLLYARAQGKAFKCMWERLKREQKTVEMLTASLEHARPLREVAPELFDEIAALAMCAPSNN